MWRYNTGDFDPPAPVVAGELTFGNTRTVAVQMQVDPGADLTCIPKRIIPSSDGLRYGRSLVAGYDGKVVVKKTCFVTVRIDKHSFDNVETLPIDGDVGLIGRDVLNLLVVTLDGPGLKLLIDGV